jgi:hypothetical protein
MEMRKLALIFLVSACAVGLAAIAAYAADQTILGRFFSVKAEPGGPTKTKVSALEKNSNDTLVGDPTATGSAGGAILQIFVNGGTPSSQSFVLNQGTNSRGKPFWSGDAVKGFKYSDSRGEQSAVKSLSIALKQGGTFKIKATISSKNGPVSIAPPDPGTNACVAVRLGVNGTSGDRYSAQFGSESELTNKDGTLFKATKPVNEGVCPSGTTTTTSASTTTTTTTTSTSTTSTSTTTTSSTTTSTAAPGCPCEGTSFGGVTWDSTFQADNCFNLGTSFYVAAEFDPSHDEFNQLRILADGTACDIRLSTFEDSDDMPLTPAQRDACVESLMAIAAADGKSCPPSPY